MYSRDSSASSGLTDIEINFLYQSDRERDFPLKALHHARIRLQLAINALNTIGAGLKSGLTDTDAALAFLHDEGVLDFIELDPAPAASEQGAAR